jgi:hypothetical protein
MGYAEHTTVPAENSRAEIERVICRYAGRDAEFSFGKMAGQAAILFVAHGRRVKFVVKLPTGAEAEIGAKRKNAAAGSMVTESQKEAWIEQETRRRWRSLLLVIKAKLEFVASDITKFEEEFLAHIVVEDGETIYEKIRVMEGKKLLPALEKPGHPG